MNNYPPGVTGTEWQIAGSDEEFEQEMRCKYCNAYELSLVIVYRNNLCWECPSCGKDNENDIDHDLI